MPSRLVSTSIRLVRVRSADSVLLPHDPQSSIDQFFDSGTFWEGSLEVKSSESSRKRGCCVGVVGLRRGRRGRRGRRRRGRRGGGRRLRRGCRRGRRRGASWSPARLAQWPLLVLRRLSFVRTATAGGALTVRTTRFCRREVQPRSRPRRPTTDWPSTFRIGWPCTNTSTIRSCLLRERTSTIRRYLPFVGTVVRMMLVAVPAKRREPGVAALARRPRGAAQAALPRSAPPAIQRRLNARDPSVVPSGQDCNHAPTPCARLVEVR